MTIIKTRKRNLAFISFILGRMVFIVRTETNGDQGQDDVAFIEVDAMDVVELVKNDVVMM